MIKRVLFTALSITLVTSLSADCLAGRGGRGGGGGGGFSGGVSRGGGGGMYGGGGGFSGGARPSPSPSFGGGGQMSRGDMGASRPSPGNFGNPGGAGGASRAPGGLGGAGGFGQAAAGQRPAGGAGNFGVGGQGGAANRFNAPSQSQLSGFLGLPSDEGFSHAGSKATSFSAPAQRPTAGSNFDVNKGSVEGPRGGQAAGVTVTGPGGNTVGKAAGVGPQGGAAVVGGVQGAAGGTAARGAAVGPGGQVVAGRGAVGPNGFGGGGVVTAGPAGVGAGFTRVTPSGRYTAAAAVRGNYNNWGIYGHGWYAQYPGAWVAAGLTANALWNASTWGVASDYCGYTEQPPIYYDYGNSVIYEDNNVYVNGDNAGTAEQYYDQAVDLAKSGAQAEAPSDGDWLPLGVFAFTKPDQKSSDITIQLAVNKDGVIRGNYTDTSLKQNQVVQGSIDKQTQKAAFTVGDNQQNIIETGLYNLTKDEAPCLLHLGKENTEQWLLVRLTNPEAVSN